MDMEFAALAQQVSRLVDRAAISDLLIAFARALDTKDWDAYERLLTDDGVIEIPVPLPDGSRARHVGRKGTAAWVAGSATRPGLGRFVLTHHINTNHQITIDGDEAQTHSYAQCVHRLSDNPAEIWELGGWYTCDVVRVGGDDWKFRRVRLDLAWEYGNPGGHGW